ncbi:MAG: PAQR family membrane homeostasis protein TrhA [Nevskiales bacterium]
MTPIIPIPGFAEPFSSISHLIVGTTLFGVLTPFLLYHGRGSAVRQIWLWVLCLSSLFLLSMSGVYHLLGPGSFAREEVLRRLDHAAIFVLIAGTFTAAHGILFKGLWRWGFISLLWLGVATAITLKTVFFHSMSEGLGLALYLGFGWLGLISGIKLWRGYGYRFIRPLLWGGVAYSVGAIIEFLRWPVPVPGVIGPHELFHVAVLIGLGFHWYFVWEIAGEARRLTFAQALRSQLPIGEIDRLIKAGVGVTEFFDFQVEEASKETVTVRLAYHEKQLRAGASISGPVIMMLADTAMYAQIMAAMGPELLAVTTSMTLNFLTKPPPADLMARGRLLKLGKRLAVMDVEIRSAADQRLVAHVTGTYSIPPRPEGAS